jgi:hypothetical protein
MGATAEYGVGVATSSPPIMLTEKAPAMTDDSGIQTWLATKLGVDPAWPAPDANNVYVLFYPTGTTITQGNGQSCVTFGGYHAETMAGVPYAVIPRCLQFGPTLMGIDAVTSTTSHELAEAATDPHPFADPAFDLVDQTHHYWAKVLLPELGDMCAQFDQVFTKFPNFPYTVQRIWSNKSVKAGHDPCQPTLPNWTYFNAPPELPDSITVSSYGGTYVEKAVKIAVGKSRTIVLDLYSDGPMPKPWKVIPQDETAAFMGGTPLLKFSQDKQTGLNGEKINLTITVVKAGSNGTEPFFIQSTDGTVVNMWLGLVSSM